MPCDPSAAVAPLSFRIPTWSLAWLVIGIISLGLCNGPLRAEETTAAAEANATAPPATPAKKIVYAHIELKGSYADTVEAGGLFGELEETLSSIVKRIDRVGTDLSVEGVILHINSPQIGWAKLNELRAAVARVRAQGKKTLAWLESGETTDYLLATACETIVMPESGMLIMPGPRAEITFYKNLFDNLSIQADMLRVGEFKSAAEPYTRTEISPEFKLELEAILEDHFQRSLGIISETRHISAEQAQAAIDTALLNAPAALAHKLIDQVAYEDQLKVIAAAGRDNVSIELQTGYAKPKLDTDFSGLNGFVKMMNLLSGVEPASRASKSAKIAIVYATGMIMPGPSVTDLMGGQVLGSTTMIKAIRQARDDETVKAIVLRIDSPGGSALASDLIWHELETVTKPVVVSMGDTAASGGYYIAMGADRIFAEPGTLTGSIGVVGGKFALEKCLQKFGVNTSVLQRGKNGGIISVLTPFTDSERTAFQQMLNDTYKQFTEKAAAGRKMEYTQLEALARGRVYTGTQALAVGLVDQLGTVEDAVAFAKQAAGLTATDRVERLRLPKPTSPIEQLFGPIDSEARLQAAVASTVREVVPSAATELLQGLNLSTLLASEPVLTVLPYQLRIR